MTRNLLLKQGYECPKIYGDPALLLPKIYLPRTKHTNKIGFIPHFADKNKAICEKITSFPNVKFIDICMPVSYFTPSIFKNFRYFIDSINECDIIISSCLHGLITADAYRKKTLWVKFGNDLGGDDIKFYDYYLSMGLNISPIVVSEISKEGILSLCSKADIKPTNNIDIDLLLEHNPFQN